MLLAVNGTLMSGLELNQNLVDAGAEFIRTEKTSTCYRMWSIDDRYPAMQRDDFMGNSLTVEIWSLDPEGLMQVLEGEPPGLSIGSVLLHDNSYVFGVIGESYICKNQREITRHGGWREYMTSKQ